MAIEMVNKNPIQKQNLNLVFRKQVLHVLSHSSLPKPTYAKNWVSFESHIFYLALYITSILKDGIFCHHRLVPNWMFQIHIFSTPFFAVQFTSPPPPTLFWDFQIHGHFQIHVHLVTNLDLFNSNNSPYTFLLAHISPLQSHVPFFCVKYKSFEAMTSIFCPFLVF